MHVRLNRDIHEPKGVFMIFQEIEATQAIREAVYKRHQGRQDRLDERERSGPGRTLHDQGNQALERGDD